MGTEPPTADGGLTTRPPDSLAATRPQIDGPPQLPPEPLNDQGGLSSIPGGPRESLETRGRPLRDVTTPSDAQSARGYSSEQSKEQAGSPRSQAPPTQRLDAHAAGATFATHAHPAASWSDKVRGVNRAQSTSPTAEQIRGARMLQGVWNPLHIQQLTATLTTDWTQSTERTWTEDERAMRALALAPATANRDDSIRPWTPRENDTLVAYMGGALDLPHPPNFTKEIMIAEHRAMVEDFHARYLDVTLTANLPPTVRLSQHTPHAELFKELFQANTDSKFGAQMLRVFQADVKRLDFDGLHTLKVVFYSRTAATRWVLKALRFQRAVILLQDTARLPGDLGGGTFNAAQLELQYAVRVYGAERLSLVALTRAFQLFADAKVLDVEYARASKTAIYDNRYHTVRFAQTDCPGELKEVTRLELDGKLLTIHHFQTHLRRPCGRCCSPHHGGRRCKTTDRQVEGSRARHTRLFAGMVDNVQPATRTAYAISSTTQLVELLTTLQGDVDMRAPAPLLHWSLQTHPEQPSGNPGQEHVTTQGDNSEAPGPRSGPRAASAEITPGDPAEPATPDAAGYTLHRSKGARKAAQKGRAASQTPPAPDSALNPKTKRTNKAPTTAGLSPPLSSPKEPAPAQTKQKGKTVVKGSPGSVAPGGKPGNRKSKSTPTRFQDFQREEAKGYYGALLPPEDSDEDTGDEDEVDVSMHVDSEPGNAEDAPSEVQNVDVDLLDQEMKCEAAGPEHSLPSQAGLRRAAETRRSGAPVGFLNIKQQSMDLKTDKADKLTLSASVTKETRRQQIEANRTGLGELRLLAEEKSGLVQTSMARYMHSSGNASSAADHDSDVPLRASIPATTRSRVADEVVPATPDSQEGFSMGPTRKGTAEGDADNPIQVGQWLSSFAGFEVNVEANGHCAFLALYASTKNHERGTLANSAATVKHATSMKATIYAGMMANLRHDVALGLVDPIQECARVYPRRPPPTSVAAATADLFAHYALARDRPVDKWQPVEYWAGPHELRAMAQFLREPLLVLDAGANNDAHVQRYLYKDYRLDNGTDHESGYVEALTDREAAEYLRTCFALHVMPTFMVLRRQERHFYGVGHGELWVRWQAEGDSAYAALLPDTFDWKLTINHLTPAEALIDMHTLNLLEDTHEVNTLIAKRVNTRDRLDIVHARRGLPTLDQKFLITELDDLLRTEESLIHAAYGADGYAADLTSQDVAGEGDLPVRYTKSAAGAAVERAYCRILEAPDVNQVAPADVPLMELMHAENREAFIRWSNLHREELGIPATRIRRAQIDELQEWLLGHYVAMRHLFAYLPYPELEAKRWSTEMITAWGTEEVVCEQMRALLRIVADPKQPKAARNYCAEWHDACMVPDLPRTAAAALAQSGDRWKRLTTWLPATYGRACPHDIPARVWSLLHVLPYIIEDWALTPMGRAPHEARELWFRHFDPVRHLCSAIATVDDWSGALGLVPSRIDGMPTEAADVLTSDASASN